jgi:hypothetical protein
MLFDLLATVALGAWALATVFNQFPSPLTNQIRRMDRMQLVPLWTFFAPNPGTSDYHVVYRDLDAEGRPCRPWEEVCFAGRTPLSAFWNPQKRASKVVNDLTQSMIVMRREDETVTRASVPYVLLLQSVVRHAPCSEGAVSREFMIVQTSGWDPERPPELVFRSVRHRLGAA